MESNTKIGARISFKGQIGTVKFSGPLTHEIPAGSKIDKDAEWLGVEWDNPEEGKHNGTVKEVKYFECTKPGNCGSIVKASKVDFGFDFIHALIDRYFKEHETLEIMKHRDNIVDYLKQLHETKKVQ